MTEHKSKPYVIQLSGRALDEVKSQLGANGVKMHQHTDGTIRIEDGTPILFGDEQTVKAWEVENPSVGRANERHAS